MIISTKKGTPKEELEKIVDRFEKQGLDVTLITGKDYNVFGLVGDTTKIDERDVLANPWIDNVTRVSAPYKRANRLFHPADSVIDCGGVGYACMTTNNTLSQLKKGEKTKLYAYLNVGESVFDLYGFATQNELNSFKLLLGVSGVGPKAALAILSANTPEGLAMAIVPEDAKSLTAAQGIGKKIAQRIILELKDKMAKETASGLDFSGGKGAAVPAVFTSKATEAAAALAVLVLLPTVKVFDLVRQRSTGTTGAPKTPEERRCLRKASLVCGTLLFVASAAQQFGLTLNPSTAKAGFLTAMYVVLVPIFGLALGRRGSPQLWLSVAIAVCGLYLLCMQNGFGGVERSDMVLLLCAVLFSFQIMAVNHYGPQVDGVRLSLRQFFVVAVESSVAALLLEHPAPAEFAVNAVPLLYCGVMSSGVAYTLQILGQRDMNPAVGSLIMCLESVFSALGGWALLHQSLSPREGVGCVLIFAAVVLAQLPVPQRAPQRAERAS